MHTNFTLVLPSSFSHDEYRAIIDSLIDVCDISLGEEAKYFEGRVRLYLASLGVLIVNDEEAQSLAIKTPCVVAESEALGHHAGLSEMQFCALADAIKKIKGGRRFYPPKKGSDEEKERIIEQRVIN